MRTHDTCDNGAELKQSIFHCRSRMYRNKSCAFEDVCRMLAHKLLAQIAFALAEHTMMTTTLVAYSGLFPAFLRFASHSHPPPFRVFFNFVVIPASLSIHLSPPPEPQSPRVSLTPTKVDISIFILRPLEHSEIIARCNVQLFQCKPSSKRLIPGLMYSPLFT